MNNIFISEEGYQKLKSNGNEETKENIYWTIDKNVELPILLNNNEERSKIITIPYYFKQNCIKFSSFPALLEYDKELKLWNTIYYKDYYEKALNFANYLIKTIPKRSSVCILSYNRSFWNIAFYGCLLADMIPIGLYITSSSQAIEYILNDSLVTCVIVEDESMYNKLIPLKNKECYNRLKSIVSFEKIEGIKYFKEIINDNNIDKNELEKVFNNIKPGKCAVVVYTSGTTSNPKGVMLSHDNYLYQTNFVQIDDKLIGGKIISYLPLSHVASQSMDLINGLTLGLAVYFADKDALKGSLKNYLLMVKPDIFLGVPRVYEKIEESFKIILENSNFLRKKLINWAFSNGISIQKKIINNEELTYKEKLAKKLFNKIKSKMGFDNLKFAIAGSAPFNENLHMFFYKLGIVINNMYGMSETAGTSTLLHPNEFIDFMPTSVGKPAPGININLFEGEICFKGRNTFMGYVNNKKETIKTIDLEKYTHSGDLGKYDKNGNLYIVGRIKELIITKGGENISPILLENSIIEKLPFISVPVVIGDNRKYLICLLTIKTKNDFTSNPSDELAEEVKDFFKKKFNKIYETINNIKECKLINNFIQENINQINKNSVSRAAQVKKWIILENSFSIPTLEFTPTLKLKRKFVENKYSKIIEKLYLDPGL